MAIAAHDVRRLSPTTNGMRFAIMNRIAIHCMRWAKALLLSTVVLVMPAPALAALGESIDDLPLAVASSREERALSSRSFVRNSGSNRVRISLTSAGTMVRQFANASGTVFLVMWEGPQMPNLEKLLGTYYPSYANDLRSRRIDGIRGPVQMHVDTIVVESGGRMRNFAGHAYLPALLPADFNLEAAR